MENINEILHAIEGNFAYHVLTVVFLISILATLVFLFLGNFKKKEVVHLIAFVAILSGLVFIGYSKIQETNVMIAAKDEMIIENVEKYVFENDEKEVEEIIDFMLDSPQYFGNLSKRQAELILMDIVLGKTDLSPKFIEKSQEHRTKNMN